MVGGKRVAYPSRISTTSRSIRVRISEMAKQSIMGTKTRQEVSDELERWMSRVNYSDLEAVETIVKSVRKDVELAMANLSHVVMKRRNGGRGPF